MELITVTRVGKDNKTCFQANESVQYFVPAHLRDKMKVGVLAITNPKTFDSETVALVDAEGKPTGETEVRKCASWTRHDITFIGTEDEVIAAARASQVLNAKADAYVAQQTAEIAVKYALKDVKAA